MSKCGILCVCFDTFSSKSGHEITLINNYNQSCSIDFRCCSLPGKKGVKPHILSAVCPFGFMCWLFQLVIENVGCYLSLKNQKILYIIDI